MASAAGAVLGADLEAASALERVHRGLPQLIGVHLAQPLVTLDGGEPLAPERFDLFPEDAEETDVFLLGAEGSRMYGPVSIAASFLVNLPQGVGGQGC